MSFANFRSPHNMLQRPYHLASTTVAFFLILLAPLTPASATEFELSRIARDINFASSYLAKELKYSRGFGSVGQRADRLARDSGELVEAIRRNRSSSYVRSKFDDVSRRYTELEDVYLRVNRNYSDEFVFNQVGVISNLYSELSSVFYYTSYYARQPRVFTYVTPRRSFGHSIPPVFYGGNISNQGNNNSSHRSERRTTAAQRNREHRSSVVERLNRIDDTHRSSQRIIRQRHDRTTETHKPNHYD